MSGWANRKRQHHELPPEIPRTKRFAFYTDTYLSRSEVWLFRQANGMHHSKVDVIARWGTNLKEFPVANLFLADEFRHLPTRLRLAAVRRLDHSQSAKWQLPEYAIRRIVRHLQHNPPDLIYCMFGWNAAQLLDILDRLGRRTPFVFFAAGSDINAAASYGEQYLARLSCVFERADVILSGSEFLREKLVRLGAPPEKIRVHYLGVDIPTHDPKPKLNNDEFRILGVSRIVAVKGVPHTLRAFRRVVCEIPSARLEVIGDGVDLDACMSLAGELGLLDNVTFRGSCSIADVYRSMEKADLFVQHNVRTSCGQEESISGTMLEAAAHGVPAIITRSGGNAEGVIDGVTGLLVEPGDEAGMADAIIDLARDASRRASMGSAGRDYMIQNFDGGQQNAKLESMLANVAMSDKAWNG